MKQVMLLVGLPGSGKSTWALQFMKDNPGWKRINKDSLRAMLDGGKWSKANEKFVLGIRDEIIVQALMGGWNVIIDDTNLDSKHLEAIKEEVTKVFRPGKVVVREERRFVDVPLETCIANDLKRPNSVGEQVIRSMYDRYLRPLAVPVAHIPGVPSAIIVDLDGTLAIHQGRDPYDCSRCEEDALNLAVDAVVDNLWHTGAGQYQILLVSGRDESCRTPTKTWLANHTIHWDYLYMRATGDKRDDRIVKEEIYRQQIEGKYNVLFVLDDRNKVVDMWRSLGLTCFQVAEGNF